jgi:hypothetical protein
MVERVRQNMEAARTSGFDPTRYLCFSWIAGRSLRPRLWHSHTARDVHCKSVSHSHLDLLLGGAAKVYQNLISRFKGVFLRQRVNRDAV